MIYHRKTIVLAGFVIFFVMALSVWMDSQDANDARMAKKITTQRR